MCFLMDPVLGEKNCYVQFPQRFDGIDQHDRYSNHNVVFFDINMKGLDGIQGPIYVGTGCVFRRHALYGYDAPTATKPPSKTCNCWPMTCCLCCRSKRKCLKAKKKQENQKKVKCRDASKKVHALEVTEIGKENAILVPQEKFEKRFGQSQAFLASTLQESGEACRFDMLKSLDDCMHVLSCGLVGFTDLSLRISSQASRCIATVGGLFTACRGDQHSRDQLLSILPTVSIKF